MTTTQWVGTRSRGAFFVLLAMSASLWAPRAEASSASLDDVEPYAMSFGDEEFLSHDPLRRDSAFDRAAELDGNFARVNVDWRGLAPVQPADPADPADPEYEFEAYDTAVRNAYEHGLVPVFTVVSAPQWAEGPNRPADARLGTWKPSAPAFRDFARALATRYSGTYVPSTGGAAIPRVQFFEVWNEPNQTQFLAPQWNGTYPNSPDLYRRLLNSFYRGAHSAQPDAQVIAGALAPFGDQVGGLRVRPIQFMRRLLCLGTGVPSTGCNVGAKFDIFSVHPISPATGPRARADQVGDLSIADLRSVKKLLRAASATDKRQPRAKPAPLWVSEYWWETNPPDDRAKIPTLDDQARWIADAQFAFWQLRIEVAFYYQLEDDPLPVRNSPIGTFQTGLYFINDLPKPSLQAAYFPLAARRITPSRALVWFRPPQSGRLLVERSGPNGWAPLRILKVVAGHPQAMQVRLRSSASIRATVAGNTSYAWRVDNGSQASRGSRTNLADVNRG